MDRHAQYVATLLGGLLLIGHAFQYEGLLLDAGLVSLLDPVGAISPMPYGAYHVGSGVSYGTTAVIGLWGLRQHLSLRGVGLGIAAGVIAVWIGVYAFWTNAGTLQGPWSVGFVLAPSQIVLFPMLGIWAGATGDAGPPRAVFNIPLYHLFVVGSVALLLPAVAYAGAGIVAGGWGILNAFVLAAIVVLNLLFGYPLYRLGRGVSGWGNDPQPDTHRSRS